MNLTNNMWEFNTVCFSFDGLWLSSLYCNTPREHNNNISFLNITIIVNTGKNATFLVVIVNYIFKNVFKMSHNQELHGGHVISTCLPH